MPFTIRVLVMLLVGAVAVPAWAQSLMDPAAVLQALRGGGYVIVFRHGGTHGDQADTDPLNPDNVDKQRHLNDRGRAEARAVGEIFRRAGIPIGKSYSSRFQRAVETARLIGGKEPQPTLDVTEGGLVIIDAFGKDWFEIKEGEASIFKPEGGGKYSLVSRVPIERWAAAR